MANMVAEIVNPTRWWMIAVRSNVIDEATSTIGFVLLMFFRAGYKWGHKESMSMNIVGIFT